MFEICEMQILIVSATEMEIAPLRAGNVAANFLITGVGGPACMFAVAKALSKKRFDLVIQAGIAGVFTREIALGETVLVKKDIFADLGIYENGLFTPLFATQLSGENTAPYQEGWLINNNELLAGSRLKKVNAVTVNTVGDDPTVADRYMDLYNAEIESMEGAAFHYACLVEKIPFLQVRSISNRVGERLKSAWKIEEAVNNLNEELYEILKTFSHSTTSLK